MTLHQLALILTSVTLTTLAQILLKLGAGSSGFAALSGKPFGFDWALGLIANPAIIGGFATYGASALLWLWVLKSTDLSVAYPFVGLGFIAIMAIGYLAFGEPVGFLRIIGTLLIVIGVALVARSA